MTGASSPKCRTGSLARCLLVLVLLLGAPALAGVVDYLTGARLQFESSQIRWVAGSLEFLLESEEHEIRTHAFPSYSGTRIWSLERFITAYFIPDHTATLGEDPASGIVTPEAREILRGFYRDLVPSITWAAVPE